MTVAKNPSLLEELIKMGLRLNDVFEIESDVMLVSKSNRVTILDYALDVEAYLNKRFKKGRLKQLIEKHTGPITNRRYFVEAVIDLLKSHGAKRAGEI